MKLQVVVATGTAIFACGSPKTQAPPALPQGQPLEQPTTVIVDGGAAAVSTSEVAAADGSTAWIRERAGTVCRRP